MPSKIFVRSYWEFCYPVPAHQFTHLRAFRSHLACDCTARPGISTADVYRTVSSWLSDLSHWSHCYYVALINVVVVIGLVLLILHVELHTVVACTVLLDARYLISGVAKSMHRTTLQILMFVGYEQLPIKCWTIQKLRSRYYYVYGLTTCTGTCTPSGVATITSVHHEVVVKINMLATHGFPNCRNIRNNFV